MAVVAVTMLAIVAAIGVRRGHGKDR